ACLPELEVEAGRGGGGRVLIVANTITPSDQRTLIKYQRRCHTLSNEQIMSDWLLNLPVIWMSLVVFGATYLFAAALYALITALATTERAGALKAISPGMLPPLATVFALLVGFLGSQVWSEADRANTAVNREASALKAVVLIAAGFPPAT